MSNTEQKTTHERKKDIEVNKFRKCFFNSLVRLVLTDVL